MKKKIAAFVLATALVLPTSLTAFAATPSDVVGKPAQSAVEELTALGIIAGYEDGTFKPDNTITRAELAKVIVIGSGNEGAAKLMANVKPSFKDVKAGAWYTGYINAAATKGYILGDKGTKNFRPSDPIKFEEVVAVLVRALGYQEGKLSGAWPYNYLLKAQDLGLFNSVDLNVGGKAVRGVVAQLTSNTLNAKLVTYNADGIEVLSANALVSKLGNTSSVELLSNAVVDGKITVRYLTGTPAVLTTETISVASNFIVTGGKSIVDLFSHNVTLVKGADGKALAITDAQAADKVVSGTIVALPAGKITIKVGTTNKDVTVNGDTKFYVNGVEGAYALPGNVAVGDEITVYSNNNGTNISAAVTTQWTHKDSLVTTIEAKNAYREARLTTDGKNGVEQVFVTANTSVTLDGKAATLADIKADDVVRVVKAAGVASKVEVVRATATGKLESVGSTNGVAKFSVSGKAYETSADVKAANIVDLVVNNIGKDFSLVLNKDGKVVKATTAVAATNKPYAVIVHADNAVQTLENGKIVTKQEVVYYSVKENKNISILTDAYVPAAPPASAVGIDFVSLIGDLVELTFNADGKVTAAASKADVSGAGAVVGDITATQIPVGATSYIINSNTVVVNVSKLGAAAVADRALTTEAIAKVTKNDKVIVYAADNVNASYILLVDDVDGVSEAKANVSGLFVEATATNTSATAVTYVAKLNVGGEVKSFDISQAAFDALVDTDGALAGDTTSAAKNDIVTLRDSVLSNTIYDVAYVNATYFAAAAQAAVAPTTITVAANQAANTFDTNGDNYIVSAKTTVFVINTDGTIYTGNYVDVKDLSGAAINAAPSAVASVSIADAGTTIGGFHEAAVIVITKK